MIIYIASDHRGFKLKETLKIYLVNSGYTVHDLGNDHYDENDDYPDFAIKVSEKISEDSINNRGILLCGSGIGVDIVANKFHNVRSSLVFSPDQAYMARNDDDANILSLAATILDEEKAKKIVSVWLQTPFSAAERHKRRLEKIKNLENR
ncbi:MAG: RpiB/LacA/LacB family sugar-phosphate isomerase [bacterium]|nr:RpiB/LacA/LacB family sugar-phosphate isomerase [bacterium]